METNRTESAGGEHGRTLGAFATFVSSGEAGCPCAASGEARAEKLCKAHHILSPSLPGPPLFKMNGASL